MKIVPLLNTDQFKNASLAVLDLAQANDEICANYFAVREDQSGMDFIKGLYQAALRGAKTRLIVDDYGSCHPGDDGAEYGGAPLSDETLAVLTSVGVEVFVYHPIRTTKKFAWSNLREWERFSRRNHNKNLIFNLKRQGLRGVVIGDSQWADEHFSGSMRGHNVLVVDRRLYVDALAYSYRVLGSASTHRFACAPVGADKIKSAQIRLASSEHSPCWDLVERLPSFKGARGSFLYSDVEFPDSKLRRSIQDHEIDLIRKAKKDLWYCTPYFAPDLELQNAFSGTKLDQRILIGKFREDPYLPYGVRKAAKNLLKNSVDIREYVGAGNIHYKEMLADEFVFVKTSNGEGRSRFYNLDTGILFESPEYSEYMRAHLKKETLSFSKLSKETCYLDRHPFWKRAHKALLTPLYYRHL